MTISRPTWPEVRQALLILGLLGVQYFSWAGHTTVTFNGLASPLFLLLTAYLVFLATRYPLTVLPRPLFFFSCFVLWVLFADMRSGEFLPALTKDTHWFILPLAVLLMAKAFREVPQAFLVLRAGAALCILHLILTLYVRSEWNDNWYHPPYFGHIRHLGLSIGFMTLLLYVQDETKGLIAAFFRISRILGLAMVFWSGSRSSMLGWACCIGVFIFHDRRWAAIMIGESVAAILLSLIPPPPLLNGNGGFIGTIERTMNATSANALSSSRLEIWKSVLSSLDDLDRSWTGLGGNGFARLQVMHAAKLAFPGHVQAHSVIVQSICDWGYTGLILLSAFFYQSTAKTIIRIRDTYDPTGLAGVLYLLVTGFLDATFYHLEHIVYLAIAMAWMLSRKPPDERSELTIPAPVVTLFLLGMAAAHILSWNYRIGLFFYFPTR